MITRGVVVICPVCAAARTSGVLQRRKSCKNRDVRDFGWEIAHAAVSRRPPTPVSRTVARTHMNTYDAKVWALCIVQGPFAVAPCPPLTSRFATFASLYACPCHSRVHALGHAHPAFGVGCLARPVEQHRVSTDAGRSPPHPHPGGSGAQPRKLTYRTAALRDGVGDQGAEEAKKRR